MSTPVISLIATAIHTEFWQKIYADLSYNNSIPFEIVFTGNVRPTFPLPENFIYIYSDAKPVQCLETSCRNARGKYVMMIMDDQDLPLGMLDSMFYYVNRMLNDKAVVIARFADSAEGPPRDILLTFAVDDPGSPVVAVNFIVQRSIWQELGGLDRRFYAFKADLDLQMRFYEAGGHPFMVPDCLAREKPRPGSRLTDTYGASDGAMLYSFWLLPDESVSRKRLCDVQSFTKEEIPIVR